MFEEGICSYCVFVALYQTILLLEENMFFHLSSNTLQILGNNLVYHPKMGIHEVWKFHGLGKSWYSGKCADPDKCVFIHSASFPVVIGIVVVYYHYFLDMLPMQSMAAERVFSIYFLLRVAHTRTIYTPSLLKSIILYGSNMIIGFDRIENIIDSCWKALPINILNMQRIISGSASYLYLLDDATPSLPAMETVLLPTFIFQMKRNTRNIFVFPWC